MKRDAAEVLKRALALPTGARIELAEPLLASLSGGAEVGSSVAWVEEIDRRIAELDAAR
jgi:hypothetical protein